MTHDFDHGYWQAHWQRRDDPATAPVNPHLVEAVAGLRPGTALDAGCGDGAEARWLADQGWQVTGADISGEALARAARRDGGANAVRWVEADLEVWAPDAPFDLVTTHYAHATMPQLDLYRRLAGWVAPGGTLLIVGHLAPAGDGHQHGHGGGHGHQHGHGFDPDDAPPAEATVTAATTAAVLDPDVWHVVTAAERVRTGAGVDGAVRELHDVVVRAVRRV